MASIEETPTCEEPGAWYYNIYARGARPLPQQVTISVRVFSDLRLNSGSEFSIDLDGTKRTVDRVVIEHAAVPTAYLEAWRTGAGMRAAIFPRETPLGHYEELLPPPPPPVLRVNFAGREMPHPDDSQVRSIEGAVTSSEKRFFRLPGPTFYVPVDGFLALVDAWKGFSSRRSGRGPTPGYTAEYRKRKVEEARTHLARGVKPSAISGHVDGHDIRTLRGWANADGLPSLG